MDRTLTVKQLLVEVLPISKPTLYRLVQTRQIPFIRLGGKLLLFKESAVREWLDKQANKAASVGQFDRSSQRKGANSKRRPRAKGKNTTAEPVAVAS